MLRFFYDDLVESKFFYTRDEVCILIQNALVLCDETLLRMLKAAVDEILKGYKQGVQRNRDAIILGRSLIISA